MFVFALLQPELDCKRNTCNVSNVVCVGQCRFELEKGLQTKYGVCFVRALSHRAVLGHRSQKAGRPRQSDTNEALVKYTWDILGHITRKTGSLGFGGNRAKAFC